MRAFSLVLLTTLASSCDHGPASSSPDGSGLPAPAPDEKYVPAAEKPAAPAEPPQSLDGVLCENGTQPPSLLASIRPATPADYVELRGAMHRETIVTKTHESVGTACARASDPASCKKALAAATSDHGFGQGCPPARCHEMLVYTRGDEVGVINDMPGLRAFLGPIDAKSEALLLLRAQRFNPGSCQDVDGGGLTATDFGWTVKASKRIADCPVEHADYELNVTSDGQINVVSEKKRPMEGKYCI